MHSDADTRDVVERQTEAHLLGSISLQVDSHQHAVFDAAILYYEFASLFSFLYVSLPSNGVDSASFKPLETAERDNRGACVDYYQSSR